MKGIIIQEIQLFDYHKLINKIEILKVILLSITLFFIIKKSYIKNNKGMLYQIQSKLTEEHP